jgi:hypoxanthine phosphoribosyltransferase
LRTIEINGKVFQLYISAREIEAAVAAVAYKMKRDLEGKNPVFIGLLNGAFMFCSDLMKQIDFECNISFVKVKSYNGLESSGQVDQVIGLTESIKGRIVIVVEDIVDTGTTLSHFLKYLKSLQPAEIKVATMFYKPDAVIYKIPIDYTGIEIKNKFVVGYGLDYNGIGRNFKDLYELTI